ncbi:hypothetical protein PISL3812_08138 [Talaromyces islandicus]|uniref:BTB domain-containing protein n=1 Tax=Talaromyces islandicus TaxID=28573 RepID=A0A0U1M7Z6_TALIS|nr:hypothetical protein PISL3812_08138 [Talaromyces islandicus]
MDITSIYAITAGGVCATLFIVSILSYVAPVASKTSTFISKHVIFPFLLRRHRFVGPWTRGAFLVHTLYATTNLFCLCFRAMSRVDAARRAGTLSMINMAVLFATGNLTFCTDVFRISRLLGLQIHRATAWMVAGLIGLHIVLMMTTQKSFPLTKVDNLFALIGAGCVAGIFLFALPYIRRRVYEIFLRTHQIQGLYTILAFAFLLVALVLQTLVIIYRNGIFSSCGRPRALVACGNLEINGKNYVSPVIKVRVALSQPMKIEAGQYINIWMPSVSWWSWAQLHPFTVISWSDGAQETLDLLVEPQRGFSADLLRHATAASPGSASFLALITGPHGISEDVRRYESVVLLVDGFGIAAAIPYLKNLIYSYNTSVAEKVDQESSDHLLRYFFVYSRTRRVHLVWQVETLDIAIAVQSVLNSLLDDDLVKKSYLLTISIYVKSGGIIGDKLTFGSHKRAVVYKGSADYEQILPAELSGELIQRLPGAQEERGEMLVMVAASNQVGFPAFQTPRKLQPGSKNTAEILPEMDNNQLDKAVIKPEDAGNRGDLTTSIQDFFNSSRFSDLTIVTKDQEFKVHKLIVCALSDYFSRLFENNWKETTENVVRLDEDEPRSVEAMIHFMYGFSYDSSGSDRGRVSPMLFNVKVYQVGDKYSVPKLKEEAREKFITAVKACWEMDDFPVAITEAYSTTPREDRGLRDPLVQTSLEHLDVLLKNEEFKHVLRNILEFAADLIALEPLVEKFTGGLLCLTAFDLLSNRFNAKVDLAAVWEENIIPLKIVSFILELKCRDGGQDFPIFYDAEKVKHSLLRAAYNVVESRVTGPKRSRHDLLDVLRSMATETALDRCGLELLQACIEFTEFGPKISPGMRTGSRQSLNVETSPTSDSPVSESRTFNFQWTFSGYDDDNRNSYKDYAACSLEDCGYCGHCDY